MEHPSPERPHGREEELSGCYKKDNGAGGIHGQNFEYKFCALVFLRAKNKGYNFKLATNMKGLGAFGDVFVEYINEKSQMSHNFVQLKSKTNKRITKNQLLAEKGDFSLSKYYQSYIQIEEKFNCSKEGVKLDGRINESLFIIYTNAEVGELNSNKVLEVGEEEFLMTGGSMLQFKAEEHKTIYDHLQDLPKHCEFLSRLRIFYRQADEREMEFHIKRELSQSMTVPESELDLAYVCYRDFIQDWWQNGNYFLQDTNCKQNDPLWKTSEKVRTTLKLDQRKSELDALRIKYKKSAIKDMKKLIEPHKAVLIFVPGRSTTLTAVKIHQMLSSTEHIVLNLQQLTHYKTEVILAWKHSFNVLVIESDSSDEVSADLFNELPGFLKHSVAEKKIIFISNSVGNIEQLHELRCKFHLNLIEEYDDCKVTDIVSKSQMLFLEKKVHFQGVELKLSSIVKSDNVRMLNALVCDSISLLLENRKPSIGIPPEDTIKYYVDRTLHRSGRTKTCFPAQGEIKPALKGDILQEMRDTEGNFGSETATVWKTSTLLEGDGRVILVTDEPGMGKSTLLTHLARETHKIHPEIWIVRVNINNYTRELHEFKANGCDQKGVIKLLTEAAKLKETGDVLLEGRLFNYAYNSAGNMAVLVDGVDEVSPHYTEEIIQVLKILLKTKIKRIWVTSRNSVKDRLEREFQCQTYSLVHFSEEDQKRFLVKFWKESYSGIEDDGLEILANRVVNLSTEQFTVQDKQFMGIPLQSWLLAEMFKGNLKEYSTSKAVDLPEHINTVMLYDLYVEKKWDIYLSDKKGSDRTNVMVSNDELEAHKTFLYNHMAAAIVAILSTQQLEKLNDKAIAERAREFLQKITEGMEKMGIIIDVIEGRPVFQHRTLAEYLAARWLCDNFQNGQKFMRDHLFESEFHVVRSMVDRILADKYPLHEAVINSRSNQVARLLRMQESLTERDRGGRIPLHLAVSCRSPELIKLLLDHGSDVSSVDTLLDLSTVQYAIRMDDWEILSLFMEKRPDIREQVLNGANRDSTENIACALRAAARYGHNDLLKYLISEGTSVNVALPGDNSTLLHVAARSQQTEAVKILLFLGASTDSQDESGKTPLHVSVQTGNFEVTECLVEHQGAYQRETELKHVNPDRTLKRRNFLNVRDVDGNTPLHLGVATGNFNIVSYLVSAGSDLNTCNVQGDYPLTLAARCGKNYIVELLMKGEVQCDEVQIGALRAAIVAGHVDTTALLLRLGFPVNTGEKEKPIHVASRLGREEIVILLLQYGTSLTSLTETGNTALHLASEAGHLSLVKYFVELQRDGLYSLNYEKETPLHLAARNGRDYLVTYFAENGCNINAASANGDTCLHVACENGHYTTVECLLKHGAQVNAMNSADQTPLHIAARRGQKNMVELFFQLKANFSVRDKDGITALLAASINGQEDTVLFILQHGGNVEDTDGNGNSIAHFAVANENLDILKYLSENDENLDVKNSDGVTPFLKAVREGRKCIVQYLIEKNTNVNTKNKDGMKPLDFAVLKHNKQITRLLLERNARSENVGLHMAAAAKFGFMDFLQRFVTMGDDVNVKADNGESPLHAACESGQVATVQYLSENGALLNLQDNNGNAALHVAVSNGHLNVTRVLVEKGANLGAADASGSTALHIAAKCGYLNIVQYLAESFAPIDLRNAKKETALLVAAAEGNEKIVSVLIYHGAGIGVREIEGKTALDTATEKGHGVITQLLKDRAEGRIIVCYNSHNVTHTAAEGGSFENQRRSLNPVASIVTEVEKINTDTPRMFETTAEDTLDFHMNLRGALHIAAVNGSLEKVQRLVEGGIALDYGDPFGRTALWGAAENGHKSIIRFLLQKGSCVNVPDCEGVTPTDIAIRKGHWEAVDEFLGHNPIIRTESTKYLTNLLYEVSESGNIEGVRIILKCGISVNTTHKHGYTPLHVAAKFGHKEITTLLVKCGANINRTDNRGKTPFILAAEYGRVEIVPELLSATPATDLLKLLFLAAIEGQTEVVRQILKYGVSVDFVNYDGWTPLNTAAKGGNVDVVRELLNHGASVDSVNNKGWTPLNTAAKGGNVDVVRELLNHGASVDSVNNKGRTPLNTAAKEGHLEVVRDLLKLGASVYSVNNKGSTPLETAAFGGHVDVVRELLNHGASVCSVNNNGFTLLNTAAKEGHLEVVQVLLKHSANVDSVNNNGWTPLNTAAKGGHVDVVRELLSHGANVNRVNNNGFTPLNTAALEGHLEVVQVLLKHNSNVEIANNNGRAPLNTAAEEGHVDVVRELLNHGASVDSVSNKGWTPLNTAAFEGHIDVVRDLLKYGASVDIVNNNGWTSLNTAAKEGHVDVVRELLNHRASVDSVSNNGWTPLNAAAFGGYIDVVRELLNHGARVESVNNNVWAPLNTAAKEGHIDVVRMLLNHGASVDSVNNNGWTPLNTAAKEGHEDIVRELLNHGPSVDRVNIYGWTPLNTAAEEGHVEIVLELLNKGANVHIANKNGLTPLYSAGRNKHVEVVRQLVNHGAQVDNSKEAGQTFLRRAAENGYLDVIRELPK